MSYSHSLWLKEQQPERNLLSSVTYKGCIDRGGQIAAESGTALDGTPVFLIHRMCEGKAELHDANGAVTLVGWSLGGVFAREMARHQPQLVRRVITLGSPINGHPDANNMVALFRLANRGKPVKTDLDGFARRIQPPPVPCTAIYTRSDGIVAWRASVEDAALNTENVEVRGSHMGLPFNSAVIRVIVERLARAD